MSRHWIDILWRLQIKRHMISYNIVINIIIVIIIIVIINNIIIVIIIIS